MKQREIESILRRVRELKPKRDSGREERVRLLLQRQKLFREISGARVRGRVEELVEEINQIYKSDVDADRLKERAKSIRIQHLWSAIERKRSRGGAGGRG